MRRVNRLTFAGGDFVWILRCRLGGLQRVVVGCLGLGLGWRDVPDRREQAAVVEPVDPFEGRELDGFERAPWPPRSDELGLGQALGVSDREVPRAAVRARDEAHILRRPSVVERLLQGVEHEARGRAASDAPYHDPPRRGDRQLPADRAAIATRASGAATACPRRAPGDRR